MPKSFLFFSAIHRGFRLYLDNRFGADLFLCPHFTTITLLIDHSATNSFTLSFMVHIWHFITCFYDLFMTINEVAMSTEGYASRATCNTCRVTEPGSLQLRRASTVRAPIHRCSRRSAFTRLIPSCRQIPYFFNHGQVGTRGNDTSAGGWRKIYPSL